MIKKIKEIIAVLNGVPKTSEFTPVDDALCMLHGLLDDFAKKAEVHDWELGKIDTNDKPGRGLIAGFVPNPISVYIILMWAGRTEDAMAKMWADMEKHYADPENEGVRQYTKPKEITDAEK